MDEIKKNEKYTVEIEGYSAKAMGVCRVKGRAVFVPNALKGERWAIRIVKVSSSLVYARGEELLLASPARQEPGCPYYRLCGGCDCRHMSYEEELKFKLGRVNDAFRRIGGLDLQAETILGSDALGAYRNKAIFAVADTPEGPVFGFYRERSHDLIPIKDCAIQRQLSCRCAQAVVDFMRENHIPSYDEASGRGTVRHVFCRESLRERTAVLCIVSARGFGGKTQALVDFLRQRCGELSGIVLNVNKTRGNTVLSGDFHLLWGKADILDELCGNRFHIAPQSFFQVNPSQAERLYELAAGYAEAKDTALALDLYCGAGTISLHLAREARQVIGAEIVPEAVDNARENAALNGVSNVEFICADAAQAAKELESRGLRPELIVVDPPRKGLSEDVIDVIVRMTPKRLVYVSCDPATLARDLARFSALGYCAVRAAAVDMFPRTCHVECVCLLTRR